MAHVMNLMGVHYSVIGNHDFDFGLDNLNSLVGYVIFNRKF